MNALELQGLTKHYKDFTLGPLDLTLPGGTICGLIGENGAGKSTTIRLILDMVQRDGSTVTILGRDSRTASVRTKEEIGVVLGSEGIPLCLNAVQAGKVMAGIRDPKLEKYAAKTDAGEIVALGAYREDDHGISVFIANIEAHPESNPTISTVRKYAGIGRMMIAYGIQLSIDSGHGGIVTFEAKTDELYDHYIKDFHAVPIFQPHSGGPKLLMLADEGAQEIFSTYLS